MVEFSGLNYGANAASRSASADALAREILEHREEDKNRSYLGKFVFGLTEGMHGSSRSLDRMDALMTQSMAAQMAGDSRGVAEAQKQMAEAYSQDRDARKSASAWTSHSTNFAKSIGLFFPGKGAYAASALLGAADAVHPEDSLGRQSADALLGAGKGAALKYTFDKVGKSEMNIALKGATMSLGNRFAEIGLDSHTYFDKAGNLDLTGGAWKTAKTLADPHQLGNDLLTFGAGFYALKKLGLTPEFAKANPLAAQALTGAGFGFSSGFFSDVQMQKKLGEGFDLSSALKSAVLQMGLDGTAAAIGGARMQQLNNAALRESPNMVALDKAAPTILSKEHVVGIYGLDNRPIARPHANGLESVPAAGSPDLVLKGADASLQLSTNLATKPDLHHAEIANSGSVNIAAQIDAAAKSSSPLARVREFVSTEDVSSLIPRLREQGLNGEALLKVRELISKDGSVGPEQTLLVRHLEPGTKAASISMKGVDLLASCNPELLSKLGLGDLQASHIFPEGGSAQVLLQVPGSNRLRFSLTDARINPSDNAITLGAQKESGQTVSEWLRALDMKDRMSDLHDTKLIARAMEHYKAPIKRFLGGGNETIAFEMTDGGVLRITEKPFRPDWGSRTIEVNGKEVQFDASILGQRKQVQIGDNVVNYYEQQKGITPVSAKDLARFEDLIDRDGRYVFWDNDQSSWGQSQLAYVPLLKNSNGILTAIPIPGRTTNRGLALIDYDAVRITGTEPKQADGRQSWRYGQYDFEPFDR